MRAESGKSGRRREAAPGSREPAKPSPRLPRRPGSDLVCGLALEPATRSFELLPLYSRPRAFSVPFHLVRLALSLLT